MRSNFFVLLGFGVVAVAAGFIASKDFLPGPAAADLASLTGTTTCITLTNTLSLGSRGNDVVQLQHFLAQDKTIYPLGSATGYYGPATVLAVKHWQAAHGIPQSGVVGPQTRAALVCRSSPSSGGAPATSSTPTPVQNTTAVVAPTCSITVDKDIYSFGDRLTVSWSTTNAKSVTFLVDRSGALQLPVLGTYGPQGSLTVTANISGSPVITMLANGVGTSTTCQKTVVIRK